MAMKHAWLPLALLIVCLTGLTALAAPPTPGELSFDSDGVPIHYVISGLDEAEPVVLIHGFAGNVTDPWSAISPSLEKDYRVIALDCRGHGRSGKPHEPEKYGVEMVRDVVRLLDHLNIKKAHVVGYSMGAVIALNVAARFPERVLSVTLGGSGALGENRKEMMLELADSLEQGRGLRPFLMVMIADKRKLTPAFIKQVDDVVLSANDPKALAAVVRGAMLPDTGLKLTDAQIAGIAPPSLALIGAEDPVRSGVDDMQKLHPGTRVVVIAHSDHMNAWQKPEFLLELRKFLEAHHAGK